MSLPDRISLITANKLTKDMRQETGTEALLSIIPQQGTRSIFATKYTGRH